MTCIRSLLAYSLLWSVLPLGHACDIATVVDPLHHSTKTRRQRQREEKLYSHLSSWEPRASSLSSWVLCAW